METWVKGLLGFLVLVILIVLLPISERKHELYGEERIINNVVIYDVQLVPSNGYKNGRNLFHINPSVYNVVTSEGIFEINTDGPYKFDNVIPRLHKGDTLSQIKVIGHKPGPLSATNPSIISIKFKQGETIKAQRIF